MKLMNEIKNIKKKLVKKLKLKLKLKLKNKTNSNVLENSEKVSSQGCLIAREYFQKRIHYGHRPNQLNPKMIPYLYKGRILKKFKNNLHHQINIRLTNGLLNKTCEFVKDESKKGKIFLFVGTKFQLKSVVANQAKRCNVYYINFRWLGGMLTNWSTIKKQIEKLNYLENEEKNGFLAKLPIKEYIKSIKELKRLRKCLNGIKDMPHIPDIVVITHQRQDINTVRECNKLGITTIGILDTDCDPDIIDYVIPANDDSTVSVDFILNKISTSILDGYEKSNDLLKN